jgi:hypothetical protein
LLLRAFEYYEATALAYRADMQARDTAVRWEEEALSALDTGARTAGLAEKRWRLAVDEFAGSPELAHALPIDMWAGEELAGEGWGIGPMWQAYRWARDKGSTVRPRLQELAASHESERVRSHASLMLGHLGVTQDLVTENPSFEQGEGPQADGWGAWVDKRGGALQRIHGIAHTGKWSMLCRGVKRGHVLSDGISVSPGRHAATAFVRWTEPPNQLATVKLVLILVNAAGRGIAEPITTEIRPSGGGTSNCMKPSAGGWTALTLIADIPQELEDEVVNMVRIGVECSRFSDDTAMYVDDITMVPISN